MTKEDDTDGLLSAALMVIIGLGAVGNRMFKSIFLEESPDDVVAKIENESREHPFLTFFYLFLFVVLIVLFCKFLFWLFTLTGMFFF